MKSFSVFCGRIWPSAALFARALGPVVIVAAASAQQVPVPVALYAQSPVSINDGVPLVAPTRFAFHTHQSEPIDPQQPDVPNGEMYITGRYATPWSIAASMAVWRVNNDGAVKRFDLVNELDATDCCGVCVTANREGDIVYAAGYVEGGEGKDILVVAFHSTPLTNPANDGKEIWRKRYNNKLQGANADDVPVLLRLVDEFTPEVAEQVILYVAGNSAGMSATGASTAADYVVMKLDAIIDGHSLWGNDNFGFPVVARYDGPAHGTDAVSDMAFSDLNTIFVTGTSVGSGTGTDYATIRIAPLDPMSVVAMRYAPAGNDVATSLAYGGGRVFVTGSSTFNNTENPPPPVAGTNDYCTIAYDDSLTTQLWLKLYNGVGSGSDVAKKIVYYSDLGDGGTVYITGDTWGGVATGYNVGTFALAAATGFSSWSTAVNPTGISVYNHPAFNAEDRVSDMLVDKDGYVYITGKSYNGLSEIQDYVTYSLWTDGARRWVVNAGPQGGHDYFLHAGSAHGADAGASLGFIGVTNGGQPNHAGDICVLGQSTETTPTGAKVLRYTVVRYDQLIPPN